MDSTSTSNLVQKSSLQKENGIYNNAETHSNCEQVEAVDGQEGRCSGMKKKTRELKKNWGSISLSETRQGNELACVSDAADSETEAEKDNEAENTISEDALNQAVLGSDCPSEEVIVSESEDFIPLLEEAEEEKEKGVSNASRCNQWWKLDLVRSEG